MNRAAIVGIGIGAGVGGALYLWLDSNWFVVLAVAAIYTGWGYFAAQYPKLSLREFPAFDRSVDRLGYGIGLFGLSIAPLAFGQQYELLGNEAIGLFVGYIGVVGFLLATGVAGSIAGRNAQ